MTPNHTNTQAHVRKRTNIFKCAITPRHKAKQTFACISCPLSQCFQATPKGNVELSPDSNGSGFRQHAQHQIQAYTKCVRAYSVLVSMCVCLVTANAKVSPNEHSKN